ncbi:hypothetical protein HUG15_05605 [Salicibibacter cibarius]|uniref:Uncharacterized protein n=1 Tax=Salicibibacter cibarius TaxID=2743000 RepID=A0A7T6Z1A2_9BACI|nr:hypothetical protein [Salicibibacter cibarius]QQK75068.1 hypothetical protein HUG15_05270 [Salicibibacter cibarius]QQK75130.1 hypothetical protein HUG15_05605 [Salicibibacter cibarius]
MPKTSQMHTLQIRITRCTLQEAYASILENEKRGYQQVGDIGETRDQNGAPRYIVTMRKVAEE